MDIRNGSITAYNGISASLGSSNQFNINKSGTNYLNVFNNGRLWLGSGAPVDAGYQLDVQNGDVRFKTLVIKNDSVYNISIGNGAANAPAGGYSVFIGALAGETSTNLVYTIGIGYAAGYGTNDASHSVFLGTQAGQYAARSQYAHMIGNGAGFNSNDSQYSNFIGNNAGRTAYSASYSNFFGREAGNGAYGSSNSNFIGNQAGLQGNRMTYTNIIGAGGAALASSIDNSTFIGKDVAYSATNITHSLFIGAAAGRLANGASYSTFIGYQAGANYTHIVTGSHNIVIGTNITTPDAGSNGTLNIGGVLFGANLYTTVSGNPSKLGQANGQIGINAPIPNAAAALDIVSTTRGLLPPRTNTTASITNPPRGLITYVTSSSSEGLYYYESGSAPTWKRVISNIGPQSISGSLAMTGSIFMTPSSSFVLPLTASSDPLTGSAYWSGSFLFIYNGLKYVSASFS